MNVEFFLTNNFVASFLLIASVSLVRWLLIRFLRTRPDDEERSRIRWISRVKNSARFLIAMGLVIIWLFELKYLALSIAAFAVALVIATREYIQCILGSLYQTAIKMFTIGDWVQIGPHCGEVVQNDWFTTTLLEVDLTNNSFGYTGKTLVVPNNLLITGPVAKYNFMRRYVSHSFTLVRESDAVNLFDLKQQILDKANEYCEAFCDVAQRYNAFIENRLGVAIDGPEPAVRITTTNLGKNQITITIFCPTSEAVTIEQKLVADFMTFWYEAQKRGKATDTPPCAAAEASHAEH